MTDYYHWFSFAGEPILIKIVISANPRWCSEQAFSLLEYGQGVKRDVRYIFITDDETADVEELAEYWESRVREALDGW